MNLHRHVYFSVVKVVVKALAIVILCWLVGSGIAAWQLKLASPDTFWCQSGSTYTNETIRIAGIELILQRCQRPDNNQHQGMTR